MIYLFICCIKNNAYGITYLYSFVLNNHIIVISQISRATEFTERITSISQKILCPVYRIIIQQTLYLFVSKNNIHDSDSYC